MNVQQHVQYNECFQYDQYFFEQDELFPYHILYKQKKLIDEVVDEATNLIQLSTPATIKPLTLSIQIAVTKP